MQLPRSSWYELGQNFQALRNQALEVFGAQPSLMTLAEANARPIGLAGRGHLDLNYVVSGGSDDLPVQ
jgi:hypothetical protein